MRRPGSDPIEFRVLGPVEAIRDGGSVELGGPRQRALLALLLLEPGRPVSADRLVDELWQGEPPGSALVTLRSYVSRLRRALGDAGPISGGATGYALDVPPEQIDASRFERLTREGQAAMDRGAVGRAVEQLRAALELWRGKPFAGLADDGALKLETKRLEDLRLVALEERIEAELALGLAAELVEELEALVLEHPYRERLWRHLMLALYRAERQVDALAAYGRARGLLAEELGLEPGEELKQLEQAILRQEVPLVRPPEERHNLPAPLSSFVGRESELDELARLLGKARLITLTGVGGAGKTRLALEAAARALPGSPDGVYFVDLSGLAEPMHVTGHVAGVFEVREQADMSFGERLTARLRDADLLLVLDNCEHLREACVELAQSLLAACPGLRILATSRDLLGVPGETDFVVPPLALPAAGADPAELRSSEAVRLFLARAREARPLLADDDRALASAARICRDLDGLPLALELAAARAKVLSLEEIAGRLADRFRFLVSWRRLTAARHRTLEQAMDWSYELLDDEQQALLARLSVFAGGFTLTAAASVCLEGDDARAVELVGRLVDASLVIAEERDGEMRYRLLETVLQYAAQRLEERGETTVLQRRHADYVLALAEEAWDTHLAHIDLWVARLARDHDNLRVALAWSRDAGEPEHLLRLAKAMWIFWWVRGDLSEGRAWLEDALERGVGLDPGLRAHALEGAAGLAWAGGDLARASELAQTARPLFAALGDRRGESASLIVLGHVAIARQDLRTAESLFERSRNLAEEVDEEFRGGFVAVATHNLGSVALGEGDLERAASRYEAALSLYSAVPDPYGVALSELYLGVVAVEAGRFAAAAGYLGRALPVFREMGFLQYTTQCLEGIASVVHERGETVDAARLLAVADALRERTGDPPAVALPHRRERVLAEARAELGELGFAAAWAEGRALAEAEALDLAQRAAVE